MGENSKIEWTDETFNPWIGCAKVSPGCANCYAERDFDHRKGRVKWGVNGTRSRTSASYWNQPLRWNKKAAAAGVRRRVFCASLADVFEDRAELAPWRAGLFALIDATPNLDWLLLTKRPENIMRLTPSMSAHAGTHHFAPRRNVWLGTSVENQAAADARIPHLLACPAAVRFLSCEPLLGHVNISGGLFTQPPRYNGEDDEEPESGGLWRGPSPLGRDGIRWVIAGGESGPSARPFDPDWARALLSQCRTAGVPFFGKQWDKKRELPDDLMVREFPR